MAEMFIEHMYAMAGVFVASTALWFSIRGARGTSKHSIIEEKDNTESYMDKDKE
jgi:hypothetical protein